MNEHEGGPWPTEEEIEGWYAECEYHDHGITRVAYRTLAWERARATPEREKERKELAAIADRVGQEIASLRERLSAEQRRHRAYADGIAAALDDIRERRHTGEPARSDRIEVLSLRERLAAAEARCAELQDERDQYLAQATEAVTSMANISAAHEKALTEMGMVTVRRADVEAHEADVRRLRAALERAEKLMDRSAADLACTIIDDDVNAVAGRLYNGALTIREVLATKPG